MKRAISSKGATKPWKRSSPLWKYFGASICLVVSLSIVLSVMGCSSSYRAREEFAIVSEGETPKESPGESHEKPNPSESDSPETKQFINYTINGVTRVADPDKLQTNGPIGCAHEQDPNQASGTNRLLIQIFGMDQSGENIGGIIAIAPAQLEFLPDVKRDFSFTGYGQGGNFHEVYFLLGKTNADGIANSDHPTGAHSACSVSITRNGDELEGQMECLGLYLFPNGDFGNPDFSQGYALQAEFKCKYMDLR